MKSRTWLRTFSAISITLGLIVCDLVVYIDPYMHYHKPIITKFYYELDSQRYQNDGITKYFDYDAVITGTSMTGNFKTSEMDELFGCKSIKVSYNGASPKEINDNLKVALEYHPNIRYVIRGLDGYGFNHDKDGMCDSLGQIPYYLYDNNLFNDVEYLFNRDVLYDRIWNMIKEPKNGKKVGITSFDSYSNWMRHSSFGRTVVLEELKKKGIERFEYAEQNVTLTDEERDRIRENVEQNITDIAGAYPNVEFYYFLPPYSVAYWGDLYQNGVLKKTMEIYEYAISLMVLHSNIHLFGWECFELISDLNNYSDTMHYGEWINSWMLKQMSMDTGRLTKDNYRDYVSTIYNYLESFDYNTLWKQTDYEADYYAAGLLNKEISGVEPLEIRMSSLQKIQRKEGMGLILYIDVSRYRTLIFYGKKSDNIDPPIVELLSISGEHIDTNIIPCYDGDDVWHQYSVDLSDIHDKISIIFNRRCYDIGNNEKSCEIKDIILY